MKKKSPKIKGVNKSRENGKKNKFGKTKNCFFQNSASGNTDKNNRKLPFSEQEKIEISEWKRRFELVAEASGQIVYDYCLFDGSIEWSGSIEKVLGYKQSEMKGGIKQWVKLLHKNDRKEAIQQLEIAEKNLTPYDIKYRYKHKNGRYVNFHDRGFFITSPDKECIRMIGVMQDITEKIHSGKLINALNNAVLNMQNVISRADIFKTVAEELKKISINSMLLIPDNELKYLSMEYHSYDSKLIKGLEKIAGSLTKDVKLSIEEIDVYKNIVHNKKTFLIINSEEFVRQVLPKKLKFMTKQILRTFNIERFILSPLVIENKFIGMLSVQSNDLIESDIPTITIFAHQMAGAWHKGNLIERIQQEVIKQKQTEMALQESEELFRKVFEESPVAMVISDEYSSFTKVNEFSCKMLGYTEEEVKTKKYTDITHPDYPDLESEIDIVRKIKTGEVPYYKAEKPYLTKNKETVWGSLTLSSIRDKKGEFQYYLAMIEDITERKKAEKENILLAQSLKSVKDAISITDMNNKIIYVNNSLLNTYGYSEKELLGKDISILRPQKYAGLSDVIHSETIEGGWYSELINAKKDGAEFPVELWTSSVKDERNNIVATIGVARDITERKNSERKLEEAYKKLNRAQKVARIGSWEVFFPSNKRNWSDNMYEIMGFPAGINVNMEELEKRIPHEELKTFKEAIKKSIEDGKPYSMNYKIVMPGGKVKYIHDEGEIIRNEKGEVVSMFGTTQDISESRLAEIALRENEEKMQGIFRVAPTGIGLIKNRIFIDINPRVCEMTGYSEKELIGNSSRILYPTQKDFDYVGTEKYRQISEKGTGEVETKWKKKHGEIINVLLASTPVDQNDIAKGVIFTALDITNRKKAEEELIKAKEKAEEMNRIKTSFLANMSHEVRTPLVAILGFSEVLGEIVKDEEIRNYVEMIHKGGERLLDTLNLILDLSVIEAQKMKIELMPLDIVKEVNEVVKLFEKTAEKKNLSIETYCKLDSVILNLDAKILRQIMNNLVNNAVKYTNAGCIKIKIDKEEKDNNKYISIRIEDTGIGIPPDKRNLIWDEFRQASEGFNRSFEGAGLGLSITKKFVEKLGGTIFLERSDVGVGSVFIVLFPYEENTNIKDKSVQGDFQEKSDSEIKEINRKTILYIEDDPIAINIVEAFLKEQYKIDSALSGSEGIVKAKNKVYDAILMDINLGKDMNGIEATQAIYRLPGYKDIPIIAVTAFAMVGDKDEFFAKGCTHYISKPFTKQELQKIIADALL